MRALLADSPAHAACASAWAGFVADGVLPGALAAVTKSGGGNGGSSNSSFVVKPGDSTELRLVRPLVLRLSGAALAKSDFGDCRSSAHEAQMAFCG